jgi:hypothetical protein
MERKQTRRCQHPEPPPSLRQQTVNQPALPARNRARHCSQPPGGRRPRPAAPPESGSKAPCRRRGRCCSDPAASGESGGSRSNWHSPGAKGPMTAVRQTAGITPHSPRDRCWRGSRRRCRPFRTRRRHRSVRWRSIGWGPRASARPTRCSRSKLRQGLPRPGLPPGCRPLHRQSQTRMNRRSNSPRGQGKRSGVTSWHRSTSPRTNRFPTETKASHRNTDGCRPARYPSQGGGCRLGRGWRVLNRPTGAVPLLRQHPALADRDFVGRASTA